MHPPRLVWNLPTLLALAAAFVGFAAPAAPAAPAEPDTRDLAAAKLLADTPAVRPGEPFMLGVLLDVKPGWHVYWLNPGDSGRPTRVKFTAPPGYAVGELRYPVPEKFTQSDGAVMYGYSHSVLLTARVTPPKEANDRPTAGGKAAFAAEVSWLCCENLCVPGKSKCAVELPETSAAGAGASVAPGERALFAEWEKRVPVSLGEKGAAATGKPLVEPSTGAGGGTGGAICSIDLHWDAPPARVELFPAPEAAVKVSDATVAPAAAGETRVRFRAEVLKGQKLSNRNLPVVVACQDDKGEWRGVRVEFPLDESGAR